MQQPYAKAVWGAALLLVLWTPALASERHRSHVGPAPDKLDASLEGHRSLTGPQAVIVRLKPGTKTSVRRRVEARGHEVLKEHAIINALSVRVDADGLALLASDPDVETISVDADVVPSATVSTTDTSLVVSDLKKLLAIGNWLTGSSLTVAVIDSGLAPVADFSGRIIAAYDFTDGQGGVPIAAADPHGHGTHVAGLIGSSGTISSGVHAGVAPGIKFLSLRVLNQKGSGKTSDVISALQFAVANKARFGIRIINLSLGHPIYESATTDPLVQAVEEAVRAGIVVVVAAGNYGANQATGLAGYGGVTSPGNAPSAITVGAANTANTPERKDDRVPVYSSRGPSWFDGYGKPDVVAPGQGLLSDQVEGSTLATLYPSLVYPTTTGKLMKLSGSSMATGVVSGLVALMIEAHDYGAYERHKSSGRRKRLSAYVPPPPLTSNLIKAMLQYSATPLRDENGAPYDLLTQGAGEVNGLGALTLAYLTDTSTPVATYWLTTTVDATTAFGSDTEPWAQQIVWGTRLISGSGLIEVNQPAWATNIVWGTGELENIVWGTLDSSNDASGENIVWGTSLTGLDMVWGGSVSPGENIVWGTARAVWAENIVWGTALVGYFDGQNIVWGTVTDGENIVWGTLDSDIVWGTSGKVIGFALEGGGLW